MLAKPRVAITGVFVQASPSRQGKGVGGLTSPPGPLPMACAIVRALRLSLRIKRA